MPFMEDPMEDEPAYKTGKAADAQRNAGRERPNDPFIAGLVGKARGAFDADPDPNGNRAARRSAARRSRRAR